MTPEQVADLLQIDAEAVYDLIRDRKLAASKVGHTYRVGRADLEAFLAASDTLLTFREALFARVMAIADRNPDVNSDDLLDELERLDDEARKQAPARRQ
jgi:excisionase family DNA binding protein